MDILNAFLGLFILVLAGDMLVRGAVNVSLRLGVPALIVSLTIVAVGTSAPELLISVKAVLDNAPGIAIGNVVGSNIANILLVLGLPAILSGINTRACDSRGSYIQMILGTLAFLLAAWFSPITWVAGIALLGLYAVFMVQAIRAAQAHRKCLADERETSGNLDLEGVDPGAPWLKIMFYLALGIIGLPFGADILVKAATSIARTYHVSETVIGLTLVALGTSLPELATTLAAAMRRQADVALGNVIGSNMANLLAIVGISSLFGNIPVSEAVFTHDILIMAGASLLLAPFVFFGLNLTRFWGVVFTGLYLVYVFSVLN